MASLVSQGQVSLGFIEGPDVPAGLNARDVGSDTLMLVCAPGAPQARQQSGRPARPVTAAELAGLALVEREAGSGTRAALNAALHAALQPALVATGQALPARPTPLLEVSSTTAVRAAVAAGVGPAVVSSLAVGDDLAAGRIVDVPVEGVDLRRTLRAVWGAGPLLGGARELLAIATRASRPPGTS